MYLSPMTASKGGEVSFIYFSWQKRQAAAKKWKSPGQPLTNDMITIKRLIFAYLYCFVISNGKVTFD